MRIQNTNKFIYLCCLVYIISLIISPFFSLDYGFFFVLGSFVITFVLVVVNEKTKLIKLKSIQYFILIIIFFAGFSYYHLRVLHPTSTDISWQVKEGQFFSKQITIEGKVIKNPTINPKQRGRFLLEAEKILYESKASKKVSGKVYVTAPLLQVTGLYPSMTIRLTGKLYLPKKNFEPWGFNFAKYLQKDGVFSGFSAQSIEIREEGRVWSQNLTWWRRRIVQTHVRFLKIPEGNLLSSMIIGRREVDFGQDIGDAFRQTGLSHILSASGFHVSILLGITMYCSRSLSSKTSFILVLIMMFIYSTITGFYPSILRACLMGLGGAIGLLYNRQAQTNITLLLAAFILLLINPLWIQDLSFQYSFLATWGLITTVPAIVDRLDWLPPTIATLIAVPLAATVWVLPLQSYHFNYFSLYSVLINTITAPLVLLITAGGFVATFIGLLIPVLGSVIAYGLWLPLRILISIVELGRNLPFNSFAVGEIHPLQLLLIYLVFLFICFDKLSQKYWHFLLLTTVIIFITPLIYYQHNLQQVTILDDRFATPNIIIQNQRNNTLINLNSKDNLNYDILPFLRSQGINVLDTIVIDNKEDKILLEKLSQTTKIKNINQFTRKYSPELKEDNLLFTLNNKKWLIIRKSKIQMEDFIGIETPIDILVWFDRYPNLETIKKINPQVIITRKKIENRATTNYLSQQNIKVMTTTNKTIQWQPEKNFTVYSNSI